MNEFRIQRREHKKEKASMEILFTSSARRQPYTNVLEYIIILMYIQHNTHQLRPDRPMLRIEESYNLTCT